MTASLEQVPVSAAGSVLELVVARVLDHYEHVLDALEDETMSIVDDLFTDRRGEQLRRAVRRPVALRGGVHRRTAPTSTTCR